MVLKFQKTLMYWLFHNGIWYLQVLTALLAGLNTKDHLQYYEDWACVFIND